MVLIRLMALTALMLAVSGCMCCETFTGGGSTTTTMEEPYCSDPYILVGRRCCLDVDRNMVCDSDEQTTTTVKATTTVKVTTTVKAVQPTVTLPPQPQQTSTTLAPATTSAPSCTDGVKNQNEEYADCGGVCVQACEVMSLSSSWKDFTRFNITYRFRLDDVKVGDKQTDYYIQVKTNDGMTAEDLYLNTGESFVDHLRFKVVNYPDASPKIAVRLNIEDLSAMPSDATMLTIGGTGCPTYLSPNVPSKPEDLCCRNYNGYDICLRSRSEKKVFVQDPDGLKYTGTELADKQYRYFGNLQLSGLFDREHFINGGYILIYARMKG
ncbi:MAG: hypothetical protein ABIH11_03025 [Candidatus Altiarchaeota archaeon]